MWEAHQPLSFLSSLVCLLLIATEPGEGQEMVDQSAVNPVREFRAEAAEEVRSQLFPGGGNWVKIFAKEGKTTKEMFKMEGIGGVREELEN